MFSFINKILTHSKLPFNTAIFNGDILKIIQISFKKK